MSLRTRMLIVLGVGLVIAIVLLFLVGYFVVLEGFREVDLEQAQKNIYRVSRALESIKTRLSASAGDYALWDDTFERFHGIGIEGYDNENLTQDVLDNLDVDIFALITYSGQIVAYVHRNEANEEQDSASVEEGVHIDKENCIVTDKLSAYFKAHPTTLETVKNDGECVGLIPLPGYPLLIAMRRVTLTDGSGESPGVTFLASTSMKSVLMKSVN